MAEEFKKEQADALSKKQGLSPNLVDAVRDVLAGKRPKAEEEAEDKVEEGKKLSSKEKMKRGLYNELDPVNPTAVKKKFKNRKDKDIDNDGDVDSTDKYLHKRRKAISKAIAKEDVQIPDSDEKKLGKIVKSLKKSVKGHDKQQKTIQKLLDKDDANEGAFSRMDTQRQEKERLGPKKVKGKGLDTFKPKPKTEETSLDEGDYAVVSTNGSMITKKSKVHGYVKTMPKGKNLNKLLDKHGADRVIHRDKLKRSNVSEDEDFDFSEHFDNLVEDPFKGQPTGVSVTMKHKDTGKKQTTQFPGTHSAVAGAKSHIAQMQKKGYTVHSKNLMYGKKESVNELSVKKLSQYMQKSAASVSGKDARTQDKRISGQSMADKKMRKADGKSSTAKVAATNEMARRGRPPKSGVRKSDDMEAGKHIVMQLRKSVSLRGQHPVEFKSGETKKISSADASKALNTHNRLRTPIEKKNYMDKLHHSHGSFQKALNDPNPGQGPKKRGVSLAGPKFSR